MATPNTSLTQLVITTLANRSNEIKDNVAKNNALLMYLMKRGRMKTFDGGRSIYEPFFFQENPNAGWFSGYDELSVNAASVISGAEFDPKELYASVVISKREKLLNAGKSQVFDLLDSQIQNAEVTMKNLVSDSLYSDGTGYDGKELTGLDLAVPQDPTTGTYGGIDRSASSNTFWRSQIHDPGITPTTSTIRTEMTTLWVKCKRGSDVPNLIIGGDTIWTTYHNSLQDLVRLSSSEVAEGGFQTIRFMNADVVLDGGQGGFATATDMYFLNTNYLHWRPHKDGNFVPLRDIASHSYNQAAEAVHLYFMGNLTGSGAKFQGRLKGD